MKVFAIFVFQVNLEVKLNCLKISVKPQTIRSSAKKCLKKVSKIILGNYFRKSCVRECFFPWIFFFIAGCSANTSLCITIAELCFTTDGLGELKEICNPMSLCSMLSTEINKGLEIENVLRFTTKMEFKLFLVSGSE